MNKYDIWQEGYSATGQHAPASLMAEGINGEDFKAACKAFSKTPAAKGYGSYNEAANSFYGCKLFDNEKDARESFG